ncbi:cytochrome P450 [Fomitopsis serialis]|uniref:cytochrome P450 n=1 Tax=Fomitopsis serialis TaxID=139415 RepID=UPI002008C02A|nr:cytochrome P450 [Neoantrodia serialis]KAH9914354.1 cytochrome P450 [Neoantrodia serialis]
MGSDLSLLAGSPGSLALLGAAVILLGIILRQVVSYQIPGPPAQSFWSGNLMQFIARDGEAFQKHVALDYGPISKLNGLFGEPILYVSDPLALHTMLIKEEHNFQETDEFLGNHDTTYFGTKTDELLGPHHAKQRKLLNPVFSVNNMRAMLPLFHELGCKFREAIRARVQDGPQELDMLAWLARVALELIGQGALGYSFDPLVTDRADPYGEALKSLGPELDSLMILRKVAYLSEPLPRWFRRAFLKLFPPGTRVHSIVQTLDTLDRSAKDIYAAKKRASKQGDAEMMKQVGQGKDLISILLRANAAADPTDRLPDDEVVAQMSLFIMAGLDTTSNALSRILTLLATHPDHQQKLRQELLEARAADGLPYDELNRLPLLDAVIRETLRMANKDTVLPLSTPIRTTDGKFMNAIPIAKGSQFVIGFAGSNMNKAVWGEDALEWKPERWLSLPATVTEARIPGVYSTYVVPSILLTLYRMTFSGGKRACIGFKFSEMEMKVVLSILLSNFTFEPSGKQIEWNVGVVWYPTVGKENNNPELPLKVGLYQPLTAH